MIKRIKNIKNGSMKEIYENLANKEQYIKIFTKFFGEENRDRIEQLINNAVIVLYPKKIEYFKFSQFLACNYPELSGLDVDYLYEYFSKVPQLIYEKNWGELFVDYVINQFGFNSKSLMHYNYKTYNYDINSLALKKRFKLIKILKHIASSINLDEASELKQIQQQKENNKEKLALNVNKFISECDRKGLNVNPESLPFGIFQELLSQPLPNDNDDKYVKEQYVSLLNKIFNTRIHSWEELVQDEAYKTIIFPLISEHQISFDSVDHKTSANKKAVEELSEILSTSVEDVALRTALINRIDEVLSKNRVAGFFDERYLMNKPLVVINLTNEASLNSIIHEFLHLLSLNMNGGVFARNAEGTFGHKGVAFNEFVTEYLAQKMVEELVQSGDKDVGFFKINISQEKARSAYSNGIELFRPFLDAYYEELKKSFILTNDNTINTLKDVIGEDEFDKLITLTGIYFECNEEMCLKEIREKTNLRVNSFNDVLNYQEELKDVDFSKKVRQYIFAVVNSYTICERLSQIGAEKIVSNENAMN